MKTNLKTIMVVSLLVLSLLLLSACGQKADAAEVGVVEEVAEETNNDYNILEGSDQTIRDANVADEMTADATIVIQEGKITPAEITIPMDSPTILVKNMDETTQRVSIPFYGANIHADIPPGEEVVIEAEPSYVGRVALELNNAQVGGVTVEK